MNRQSPAALTHPPQRILIIKPSSLGDVATALPLLCDLQALYPKAQIDWLVDPALADLVRGHAALHELVIFDRKALGRWWTPGGWASLRRLRQLLAARQYDLVLDAQGLLRSALLAYLTHAPVRIGFGWAREGAVHFYTHRSVLPPPPQPAVLRMRSLLGPLGPIAPQADFRVPVHADALAGVTSKLPPGNGRLAAIVPGARWDSKRWSEEGFAQLAARLAAIGWRMVLLGSPNERPLCEAVARPATRAAANLAGQTSLAEMVAALSLCAVVIGNDSGPLHVAAALGRPLVGLYGPTDPRDVGPYGQLDHVLSFDEPGDYRARAPADRSATLARLPVQRVWNLVCQVAGISQEEHCAAS